MLLIFAAVRVGSHVGVSISCSLRLVFTDWKYCSSLASLCDFPLGGISIVDAMCSQIFSHSDVAISGAQHFRRIPRQDSVLRDLDNADCISECT